LNNGKRQGIKGTNYDKYKYIEIRELFKLSLKYSQYNLDFNWVLRLTSGFKCNTFITIRSGKFLIIFQKFTYAAEKVYSHSSIGYSNVLPFHYINMNL